MIFSYYRALFIIQFHFFKSQMKYFLYILTSSFIFSGNLYADAPKPIESKTFTEQMNTRYKASDAVEILKSVGVTDIEVGKMNSIVSLNSKGFFTESYYQMILKKEYFFNFRRNK